MKLNDIIVLDNEDKYTLLKEVEKDGSKYYLAAGVDKDNHINRKVIVIIKVVHEEDGDYIEIVEDEKLLKTLAEAFKDTFI